VRFRHGDRIATGVVAGNEVRVLAGTFFENPLPTGEDVPLPSVKLLAPVLPSKVVAVGKNYADHAAEMGGEVPEEPIIFLKPSTAVIGPNDLIPYPAISRQVEHEAELAVVIGRLARRVRAEDAGRYILGFTCGNDVTARDLQRKDGQWSRAKGFDGFCPLGPWVETELDPTDLAVECRVNGEGRQGSRTSFLTFGPNVLIEFITRVMTLLPGDVILTGTPAGVGPMEVGDKVEVEVEGIGTLENEVAPGD
jgi:2-keto-4-pentenoate hydratase/2-oxohepta-3-ene-1,7-dioic acid hydratase in catechol pathway